MAGTDDTPFGAIPHFPTAAQMAERKALGRGVPQTIQFAVFLSGFGVLCALTAHLLVLWRSDSLMRSAMVIVMLWIPTGLPLSVYCTARAFWIATHGVKPARDRLVAWVALVLLIAQAGGMLILLPNAGMPLADSRRTITRSKLIEVGNALESYREWRGNYPRTLAALTTPVAVLSHVPIDPFTVKRIDPLRATPVDPSTATEGAPLGYFALPRREGQPGWWLLWSVGPDGDHDISRKMLRKNIQDGTDGTASFSLVDYTYNATNGTKSNGDIWRSRER